jgi:hypothetical protein
LRPDYVRIRQRNVGRARKCSRKFSATIQQQLEMLQSDPSPAEIAEKTIDYAEAKAAYFKALREEMPELIKMATGREERPPELDTFAAALAVAGEKQGIDPDKIRAEYGKGGGFICYDYPTANPSTK